MANHDLPRRGSAAACGLITMHGMGGQVMIPAWMNVIDWKGSQAQFCINVVDRLQRAGLIRVEGAFCELTRDGRIYLGVPLNEPPKAPPVPAGPRYAPPMRSLNLAKHFPQRLVRPEGLEFRAIPSLMAGQHVQYGSGVVSADA